MKKTKAEKLALNTATIRKLTDPDLALMAGGTSYSGCLRTSTCYTKPTNTNGCQ